MLARSNMMMRLVFITISNTNVSTYVDNSIQEKHTFFNYFIASFLEEDSDLNLIKINFCLHQKLEGD